MDKILKARIVEKFGSQADFSSAMGLHESFVSRVVQCRIVLSKENQKKWAKALNFSVAELFKQGELGVGNG